jgi:hypothetical protein
MRSASNPAPEGATVVIPPLPDGWQAVTYAVLRDGKLAILGTDVDLRREWRRNEQGMPTGNPLGAAARAGARIWTFDGVTLVSEVSFPLLWPLPCFDKFPDGRWLVTNARAEQEPVGRILTREGREISRVRLGDGIQHLKIDDGGLIWVGWFDEGVFGNDGWRVPGHEWPPSSYGLASFDDEGALAVHADGGPTNGIADCYALNVLADTAWACTYTDFPILACSQRGSRWWTTHLSGSRAIAVERTYVVAAGGYAEDGNKVVLLRIGEDRASAVGEWRLPLPVGYPDTVDLIDGRGEHLHVVRDGAWHRWSVADFVSASTERPRA